MIFSSVSSGHPGKYSYEIPHEYLSGRANLSGKIILILNNHQSNLGFFSNSSLPSRKSNDFFRIAKATSSHFFRVTTSVQQLLFRSSYFFRTAAFLRSSSSRTVTFSQLLIQNSFFFRAKLLQSKHFLRIGSYLGQLHFEIAIFLAEELLRKKISTDKLLFQGRYFCTASTSLGKLHVGKS